MALFEGFYWHPLEKEVIGERLEQLEAAANPLLVDTEETLDHPCPDCGWACVCMY